MDFKKRFLEMSFCTIVFTGYCVHNLHLNMLEIFNNAMPKSILLHIYKIGGLREIWTLCTARLILNYLNKSLQ